MGVMVGQYSNVPIWFGSEPYWTKVQYTRSIGSGYFPLAVRPGNPTGCRPSAAEPQPKEKSRIHRRGTEVAELGALLDKILFSAYSASPR